VIKWSLKITTCSMSHDDGSMIATSFIMPWFKAHETGELWNFTFSSSIFHIFCHNKNKNIYYSNQWPTIGANKLHTLIIVIGGNYTYIYIYVWKLNQTVLELDFRAVKFLYFPRRDLNPHHWYTAAPFA
jgi:hypothetical protein